MQFILKLFGVVMKTKSWESPYHSQKKKLLHPYKLYVKADTYDKLEKFTSWCRQTFGDGYVKIKLKTHIDQLDLHIKDAEFQEIQARIAASQMSRSLGKSLMIYASCFYNSKCYLFCFEKESSLSLAKLVWA